MNHILIQSRLEEGNLNRMREIQFREPSADTERIQYNNNRIKTGSSKNIELLKAREGTAESSGATRFSNTSVDVQQIIVTNARNGTL